MKSLPQSIITLAQQKYAKYNVFASVQIAQWMDESNFGQDMPAGSNNPFGIKAVGNQPYVVAATGEQKPTGEKYTLPAAKFRKFNSIADAFDAHANLLANGRPYQSVKKYLDTDPITYIEHMAPIYATSLIYAEALKNFVREYNLTQYDVKPKPVPIIPIVATTTVIAGSVGITAANVPPVVHHFDYSYLLWMLSGVPIGMLIMLIVAAVIYFREKAQVTTVLGEVVKLETPPPTFGSIFDMAVDPRVEPAIVAISSLSQVAANASVAEASLGQVSSSLTEVNTSLANVSSSLTDVNTSLSNVVSSMQQDATDTANAVDAAAGVPQS